MAKHKKRRLQVETLEPRILMSASWVDAETGEAADAAAQLSPAEVAAAAAATSDKADVVNGGSQDDILAGQNGQDVLFGNDRHDTLFGGRGRDALYGGAGNDRLFGGQGDDLLQGGAGDDLLSGGDGTNTASYDDAPQGVHLDLTLASPQDTIGAGIDTLSGVTNAIGSQHDDVFALSKSANNTIYSVDGGKGNDTLDLSQFDHSQVSFSNETGGIPDDHGRVKVDLGNGHTFQVDYTGIESIQLAHAVQAPELGVDPDATGVEDGAIPLAIKVAPADPGDHVEIHVYGMPIDASLDHGIHEKDGSWTLQTSDLSDLHLLPGHDSDASFDLKIVATSLSPLGDASTGGAIHVSVDAVADAPHLAVHGVSGDVLAAIPLDIQSSLSDVDGSETLEVHVHGLPAGASLSAGHTLPDASWVLAPGELSNLQLVLPHGMDARSFDLKIVAVSTEGANQNTASASAALHVNVLPAAEAPLLQLHTATGLEDTRIPLDIQSALVDRDGSETLSVRISGLPAGAILSAGTRQADGSYVLTSAQLTGLGVTPARNSDADFDLRVTATSRETATGATAITSGMLHVQVNPVADAPTLSVVAATGREDTAIPVRITSALADTDGSETLSVRITGVPAGATLSAGALQADGSYLLTSPQLTGLTLTPARNSDADFDLQVTAASREADGGATTLSAAKTLHVTVNPVVDAPTLSVLAATGSEDTAIPLRITSALRDTDGSETLSVRITGVPASAVLSAGARQVDGSWILTPTQLSGVTLTPARNSDVDFNLKVTATSRETSTGATASTTATLRVQVDPVADAPTLSAQNATGSEDLRIPLRITSALVDTDGSETLSVRISGLPAGAILSAGTRQADGSYVLSSAQLTGLTLTPARNSDADFDLRVTATSRETATGATAITSGMLHVQVNPVADAPTLSVVAATGREDTAIPLRITSALADTDGSETLSVRITGVPAGATLSAGALQADGSYLLTSPQLTGLTLTPARNSDADFDLRVTATSREADGGATTLSAARTLHVTVGSVADAPLLSVGDVSGQAGDALALPIAAALTDLDGSEALSITIYGVPNGALLSAGIQNLDGSWTLGAPDLEGLTITAPLGSAGDYTLTIVATATENGGSTRSVEATIGMNVLSAALPSDAAIGAWLAGNEQQQPVPIGAPGLAPPPPGFASIPLDTRDSVVQERVNALVSDALANELVTGSPSELDIVVDDLDLLVPDVVSEQPAVELDHLARGKRSFAEVFEDTGFGDLAGRRGSEPNFVESEDTLAARDGTFLAAVWGLFRSIGGVNSRATQEEENRDEARAGSGRRR